MNTFGIVLGSLIIIIIILTIILYGIPILQAPFIYFIGFILLFGIYLIYYGITNIYISFLLSFTIGIALMIISLYLLQYFSNIFISRPDLVTDTSHMTLFEKLKSYISISFTFISPVIFFIASIYLLSINPFTITPKEITTITTTES